MLKNIYWQIWYLAHPAKPITRFASETAIEKYQKFAADQAHRNFEGLKHLGNGKPKVSLSLGGFTNFDRILVWSILIMIVIYVYLSIREQTKEDAAIRRNQKFQLEKLELENIKLKMESELLKGAIE